MIVIIVTPLISPFVINSQKLMLLTVLITSKQKVLLIIRKMEQSNEAELCPLKCTVFLNVLYTKILVYMNSGKLLNKTTATENV